MMSSELKTPIAAEENSKETRSRSCRSSTAGKKVPKQEQEEAKETRTQKMPRAEKRSVYSKYLKKDKDRRGGFQKL